MTDIRRTLLWVVFTMSLVLLWDAWNRHTGQPSIFGPTPARQTTDAASAPPTGAQAPGVPQASSALGAAAAAPTTSAAPTVASEKVVVTTDVLKVTFDSKGGDVERVELLKHADTDDATQNVVLFDRSAQRVYLAQTGLVSTRAGVQLPTHLTPMNVTPGDRTLGDDKQDLIVRFESPAVGGAKLVKTFTLRRGDYTVGVRHEVTNEAGEAIAPQLYLQLVRDGNPLPNESAFYSTFTGPAMYTEANRFTKIEFKDIERNRAEHDKTADNGWISMVQHYFASAWLVPQGQPREFRTAKVSENLYSIAMVLPLGEVAPGATTAHEATLFIGPQEETKLEALAPGLDLVKDYGFLTMLSKPLFWLLEKLYDLLGNWGWAIVALVVLLKLAFYGLNAHAYKSMAKMKAVNPRVMELRERYKDKPQQMQQEMMRIYREEKVNPFGGCLPILVQIPFFIALYWVLLSSVEMRNAPWIGWIDDLSARDPYFILPLLMAASSLLQVWLSPQAPDPMQRRMMWMMPIIFSVMFFFFPAGLVLYWLTNNVLSIAQQYYINKRLGVLGK